MSSTSIVIIVASRGRPAEVSHLMKRLAIQTHVPSAVIICGVEESDLPQDSSMLLGDIPCIPMLCEPGSCRQRNAGLDSIQVESDVIVFYDDDYVPSKFALEDIAATFEANPELVGLTGQVLADGVTVGGLSIDDAIEIVENHDNNRIKALPVTDLSERNLYGLYGCNMALRSAAIGTERFDERLPLYGWLEDVDFSYRVSRTGILARSAGFAGAHCGVTHGRSPGTRVGYSQIMNPVYLMRKGSMSLGFCLAEAFRVLLANHVKSIGGTEPWID